MQIHRAVVHLNPLCYDVLCWETRSESALVDPGAFMQPLSQGASWAAPTLQRQAWGNSSHPKCAAEKDFTEKDVTRIFTDNHLLFSQM